MLRAPGNAVAFSVRRRMQWSRGPKQLPNESKERLFAELPTPRWWQAEQLEQDFRARYRLDDLRRRSTCRVYAENLMWLDSLERLCGDRELPVSSDGALRAVDIGAGLFQYATGLHRFLAHGGTGAPRQAVLRGIEVDGHSLCRDGHSLCDHGRAHAQLAGETVRYEVADFLGMRLPEQDVVTLWHPFVRRYALLQWGLPLQMFAPKRLLERALAALRPGGLLILGTQTKAEAEDLTSLLAELPVDILRTVSLRSDLVAYAERTQGRVGLLAQRRG